MNSFRAVEKAIAYEIERQARGARATASTLVQETRLWDADREETRSMRSKEYAHDYRYFPEPDLLPLVVDRRLGRRGPRARCPSCRPRAARASSRELRPVAVRRRRADAAEGRRRLLRGRRRRRRAARRSMANWVMTELLRIVREEKLDDALVIRDWPRHRRTQLATLVRARAATAPSTATRRRACSRGCAAPATDPARAGAAGGPRAGERPRRARGGGRAT